MDRKFRTIMMLGAAAGLSAAIAACGPDDKAAPTNQAMADVEWPDEAYGLASAGPSDALPPLPEAEPMSAAPVASPVVSSAASTASSGTGYGYAPTYYDDSYRQEESDWYDQSADSGNGDAYALIALAAAMGGTLGNSPPDYGFGYQGAQPWVWETGDRYRRYAEPIDGGYRYYYYAPKAQRPFLVRDPYYSYAYRGDRIAYVYDRDGRVIDQRRALRQRQIGDRYYARGGDLYRASLRERRRGISAPLWAQRRADFAREQARWDDTRTQRRGWRDWDRRHDDVIAARWSQERAVRGYASDRFDRWSKTSYRGEAPRFYREAARDKQLRKAALERRATLYRQAEKRRMEDRRLAASVRHEPSRFAGKNGRTFGHPQAKDTRRAELARDRQQREQRTNQARAHQAKVQDAREQQARVVKVRQAREQAQDRQQQARAAKVRQVREQAQDRQQQARAAKVRQAREQAQARKQQVRTEKVRQNQQQAKARQQQAKAQQARSQQQARTVARRQQASAARQQQARRQEARGKAQARQEQRRSPAHREAANH